MLIRDVEQIVLKKQQNPRIAQKVLSELAFAHIPSLFPLTYSIPTLHVACTPAIANTCLSIPVQLCRVVPRALSPG